MELSPRDAKVLNFLCIIKYDPNDDDDSISENERNIELHDENDVDYNKILEDRKEKYAPYLQSCLNTLRIHQRIHSIPILGKIEILVKHLFDLYYYGSIDAFDMVYNDDVHHMDDHEHSSELVVDVLKENDEKELNDILSIMVEKYENEVMSNITFDTNEDRNFHYCYSALIICEMMIHKLYFCRFPEFCCRFNELRNLAMFCLTTYHMPFFKKDDNDKNE